MAEKLWGWMTIDKSGKAGLIGGWSAETGHLPLISRSEEHIKTLKTFAERHKQVTGQVVWLRCWTDFTDEDPL